MGLIKYLVALKVTHVRLGAGRIIGMWLRRSLTRDLVEALVIGQDAGLDWDVSLLEAHSLAGGNVTEVVRAGVRLAAVHEELELPKLLAADLAGRPVAKLAESYVAVRSQYEDLRFAELLTRSMEGEDVVEGIRVGNFRPRSHQAGWVARVEMGPMSGHALSELIESGRLPGTATVRDPERNEWIALAVARRRLGLPEA